jgi:hypothetical protein
MIGSKLTRNGIEFVKLAMPRITVVPGVKSVGHVAERLAGRFGMSPGQVRRAEDAMGNVFKNVAPDKSLGKGDFYQTVSIGPAGNKKALANIVMKQKPGAESHTVATLLHPEMEMTGLKPMAASNLTKEERAQFAQRLNDAFGNIMNTTK